MKKEMNGMAKSLLIAGLLLTGTTVFAQEQTQENLQTLSLDEVIVSATRSEKTEIEVPRSVTVITAKDIAASNASQLSEILAQQAGVSVIGSGQTPGATETFFMRGTHSYQTAIVIDGVRISDPSTVDNAVNLSEISLSNIEKIEIVRGAHSVMYGSGAVGGVINIYTRKPKENGINLNTNISGETFGKNAYSLNENLSLAYQHTSGVYAQAELFRSDVQGLDATINFPEQTEPFMGFDQDNFKKTDISFKSGYRNENLQVFAAYKKVSQDRDIDGWSFMDEDNARVLFDRNLYTYGLKYQFNSRLKLDISGGFSDIVRTSRNDSSLIAEGVYDGNYSNDIYKGNVLNHNTQLSYSLKGLNLAIGGGYYQEKMSENTAYSNLDTLDIEAGLFHAYASAELNGTLFADELNQWSLILGGRYNRHRTFGENFSFEISPSYQVTDNTLLFTSYTTGFNAPALYRLYAPYYGNTGLQAEVSKSIEIGYKQIVNENLRFDISLFRNTVENNIDFLSQWDNSKAIEDLDLVWYSDYMGGKYYNVGTLKTKGIEVSFTSKVSDKFSFNGNFSLIDGKQIADTVNISQEDKNAYHLQLANGEFLTGPIETLGLLRRANTANLTLNYHPLQALKLGVSMRYVGQRMEINNRNMEAYQLFDFKASYRINPHLTTYLNVENILNTEYFEIYGYNTKRRSVQLALNYKL